MTSNVKSEVIHIRVDPTTAATLKKIAQSNDRTMSWQALKFIKDGLENASRAKR